MLLLQSKMLGNNMTARLGELYKQILQEYKNQGVLPTCRYLPKLYMQIAMLRTGCSLFAAGGGDLFGGASRAVPPAPLKKGGGGEPSVKTYDKVTPP